VCTGRTDTHAPLLHEVHVEAPPSAVDYALTTEDGLAGWWTVDVEAEPEEGTTALFGFGDRRTVFEMDAAELVEDELVRWECTGRPDEWAGPELTWELSGDEGTTSDGGGTDVLFTHANWDSTDGRFRICNSTWGALMYRLKGYAETGEADPFFTGRAD